MFTALHGNTRMGEKFEFYLQTDNTTRMKTTQQLGYAIVRIVKLKTDATSEKIFLIVDANIRSHLHVKKQRKTISFV
jgi:hypothetical protein